MSEPVKDVDGVEFDPAIHALKKDGTPKKTPSGNWEKLDLPEPKPIPEDKPVVAEIPEKPQDEPEEAQPAVDVQDIAAVFAPVETPAPEPIVAPAQRVLMVNRLSGARLWVWPADMTAYVEQGYSLA